MLSSWILHIHIFAVLGHPDDQRYLQISIECPSFSKKTIFLFPLSKAQKKRGTDKNFLNEESNNLDFFLTHQHKRIKYRIDWKAIFSNSFWWCTITQKAMSMAWHGMSMARKIVNKAKAISAELFELNLKSCYSLEKVLKKSWVPQDHKRSPKITQDHPSSHKITQDHSRSPKIPKVSQKHPKSIPTVSKKYPKSIPKISQKYPNSI